VVLALMVLALPMVVVRASG
jgi:hypothetical protein